MLEIRRSLKSDLPALVQIFDEARGTIKALGIDQWQNGYPSMSVIENDIDLSQSFCVEKDGKIVATFALIYNGEPTYDKIYDGNWPTGDTDRYIAIHRVAILVECRGMGIAAQIIKFAADQAKEHGKASLRIDTHAGNVVMRKMLEKQKFSHCGSIYLTDGSHRVAYEYVI